MLVSFRNPLPSSLLLTIVFLTLASAVTSSPSSSSPSSSPPLQNPIDFPVSTTIDYSDYFIHQEDPVSVWNVVPSLETSSPLLTSTSPTGDLEDYYEVGVEPRDPSRPPPGHLTRWVIVGLVTLSVGVALTLLLWRFRTCRKTHTQTEIGEEDGRSKIRT